MIFDPDSIRIEEIREPQEYPGWRVRVDTYLGKARIPIQVDIAFGDIVIPEPQIVEYPTILPFPAPRLLSYPKETVVAEKLETMVALGIVNSRMKDFFDVWFLANNFEFDGETLTQAFAATFKRRRTEIPLEVPPALTDEFAENRDKAVQWKAFLQRTGLAIKLRKGGPGGCAAGSRGVDRGSPRVPVTPASSRCYRQGIPSSLAPAWSVG